MKYETDIAIVGGGLNGMALALAAAQVGLRSVLVDPVPLSKKTDPEFDGRAYALAISSRRMLTALGVWSDVAQHAEAILDIKVSDGTAGQGASPYFVHFDHSELEEGPMGHLLEDRFLRAALLDQCQKSKQVRLLAETKVVDHTVDAGSVTAVLSDDSTVCASLLIGCDGRGSNVAKRSGIARNGWDYPQSSLVCAIEHELPHNGIAHQFFTPAGPLAILPLPGNRCSIVWTEERKKAETIQALSDDEYLDVLRPVFGEFLGNIKLAGARFTYPLGLSVSESFVKPRVALVGDAAHGIHPLAGQGLNLGLRDVAALAEVLADASRRGEDIGALNVLERYQQWRRFDTQTMAFATDTINRVFSNDNSILRGVRDLALGAVNATPTLRRGLMRQAAGLGGELPKLMQGRAI